MVSVVGEKIIGIIGGNPGGSATASHIKNHLSGLLAELPPQDLEILWSYLQSCHGAIVLKSDDSIEEATVVGQGRGVLRFNSRLFEFMGKKHGDETVAKLLGMIRPLLKAMVKEAAGRIASNADNMTSAQQQVAEERAERERLGLLQLQKDPMYLIEELTKRVEKLEARR
jgi:hypothetical protein